MNRSRPAEFWRLRHTRTRPYTSSTNGKAERVLRIRCREWASALPFTAFLERIRWLPRDLSIWNRLSNHSIRSLAGAQNDLRSTPLRSVNSRGSPSCSADHRGETQQLESGLVAAQAPL